MTRFVIGVSMAAAFLSFGIAIGHLYMGHPGSALAGIIMANAFLWEAAKVEFASL